MDNVLVDFPSGISQISEELQKKVMGIMTKRFVDNNLIGHSKLIPLLWSRSDLTILSGWIVFKLSFLSSFQKV